MRLEHQTPLRTYPFLLYCKKQHGTVINNAEFTTIVAALRPIHALKGASQLFIVGWETNTFETHFQAKNYRNDPWKYSLNVSSKLNRHSILLRLSSQMVLRSWNLQALRFTGHFSTYIGAKGTSTISLKPTVKICGMQTTILKVILFFSIATRVMLCSPLVEAKCSKKI